MPYNGEYASKYGHSDIVKNPDVSKFLEQCEYMTEPSDKEGESIAAEFIKLDELPKIDVERVVASDSSPFSKPISGKFPSTQIGYVKNSIVLINISNYQSLNTPSSNFVDPFKVASIHKNANAISFVLPGGNIKYAGATSIQNGFRKAVWEQLSNETTRFDKSTNYTVAATLIEIEPDKKIILEHCPNCRVNQTFVFETLSTLQCIECNEEVYLTDSLRLHEQMSEFGDNTSAVTRFMNVVEHLIIASFVRMLFDYQLQTLSQMGFFVDGPLAIFGQPAKVHARLMNFYHMTNQSLVERGYEPIIFIGLQKTGQVSEHASSISRFLPKNSFKLIDDGYRAKWIKGTSESSTNFGHETYFGQDFIYKSKSGKVFCFAIPYPFSEKLAREKFSEQKSDWRIYKTLTRSLALINYFELELYENAIVPIALAHRHASISLKPGGQVLELLSKNGLDRK